MIREKLIPALIGEKVSYAERRILALPFTHGGMGIRNPTSASQGFKASTSITRSLTKIIIQQETDFRNYDSDEVQNTIKETKYLKETKYIEALENIKESDQVSEKFKRILDLNRDKGSGAWLIALPTQSLGYSLNKQEFQDSVCLRYG